jgi:hypothetical protein
MVVARIQQDTSTSGVADSGTNIDVLTLSTALALDERGLTEYEGTEGQDNGQIEFGMPENRSAIIGYTRQRGIVGKMAVSADITENIIRVRGFIERGLTVAFVGDVMYIRRGDKVLAVGEYSRETGYYHVDIAELMSIEESEGLTEQSKAMSARQVKRANPTAI